jgi:tRNA threonylcarbamoyladenosine biosynthesis protein TsaB
VTLLGIDTSTAGAGAAVLRAGGEAFEELPSPERLALPPAHASELMPAVARVMERAGVDYADLDAVDVGVGPGSFTGLRIGLATARALAGAAGLELRPVSSLAALASGAPEPLALALIDARRGELFAALHDGGSELWEPFAAAPAAIAGRVRESGLGPLAVGDGSVRFREELEASGVRVAPARSRSHAVSALSVCRLAARVPGVPPEAVLPRYLRAPDAKPR